MSDTAKSQEFPSQGSKWRSKWFETVVTVTGVVHPYQEFDPEVLVRAEIWDAGIYFKFSLEDFYIDCSCP